MAKYPTSITLDDDLRAAWKASGLALSDLVRRGLEASGKAPPLPEGARPGYRHVIATGSAARKTSVWLPSDVRTLARAAQEADGNVTLADLVRFGAEAVLARRAGGGVLERLDAVERALAAAPREARTEPRPRPSGTAPKSRMRAKAVSAAAAAVSAENPGAALRVLRAVPPGTSVFREPGADPVAGHPVPAAADHSAKRGLR
jgi:hypothetical protein